MTMNINDVSTPVVVLRGVESASHGALGILRSLGRLGVPVYAVACRRRTAAFFSRYCKGKYVWNVANGHAERSVNFLLDVGRKIGRRAILDRKSTRLNSSHLVISYAVFCLKKKTINDMNYTSN